MCEQLEVLGERVVAESVVEVVRERNGADGVDEADRTERD